MSTSAHDRDRDSRGGNGLLFERDAIAVPRSLRANEFWGEAKEE